MDVVVYQVYRDEELVELALARERPDVVDVEKDDPRDGDSVHEGCRGELVSTVSNSSTICPFCQCPSFINWPFALT